MTKCIRITTVVGAIWSLLVTAVLWLIGVAFSMTDRFNGPHTATLATIGLLEVGLLFLLTQAYRLRSWTWFGLLLWFAVASALSDWPHSFVFLLGLLLPVTLTLILLMVHGFSPRR